DDVLSLFDKHANTEDYFIIPAIEKHAPSVATLFEEEHVLDHELSSKLRSLLSIFRHTNAADEKEAIGGAIRYAFIEFMIFNLQHMAKEESKLNELLWENFSDDELKTITQEILGYLPPDTMAQYSTWMIRGLSNNEIKGWLMQVKNNAPEFVFAGLLAMAEKELPTHRWGNIQETITEGAMLA
ncbi:MAG: hypothetical protein V4685_07615, partial [Bacteroidota bacterium]